MNTIPEGAEKWGPRIGLHIPPTGDDNIDAVRSREIVAEEARVYALST